MYMDHFGLTRRPFTLMAETEHVFFSDGHAEAMAAMLYALAEYQGLFLLVGEPGTGKTTVLRSTLRELSGTRAEIIEIDNPLLTSAEDLVDELLETLEPAAIGQSKRLKFRSLQSALYMRRASGFLPVIVADEAHDLRVEVLELLRRISNLEYAEGRLVQIVLAGQPEITSRLEQPELRALAQRVPLRAHLEHLSLSETEEYIRWRLYCAGGGYREIFTSAAMQSLFHLTGGIPRLLNQLADQCLLAAFSKRQFLVEMPLVKDVGQHLGLTPSGELIETGTHNSRTADASRNREPQGAMPHALSEYLIRFRNRMVESPLHERTITN
ncbi:MAG TPA: AAA family ATPase [Acidobacteriaceae bacterium]|nr:AAA family ATPase [Acidobacteriaceae bacterium]